MYLLIYEQLLHSSDWYCYYKSDESKSEVCGASYDICIESMHSCVLHISFSNCARAETKGHPEN